AETMRLAGTVPDMIAEVWEVRASMSLIEGNRRRALAELEEAKAAVRGMSATTPGPYHGLWALIRSIEGGSEVGDIDSLRQSGADVNPSNRGLVMFAEAIEAGRRGQRERAETLATHADAMLVKMPWFRHVGNMIASEAAIADRWGNPIAPLSAA